MDDKGLKKDENVPPVTNVPIRDYMVNTAVHFLQNPKVQSSPLSQKRAFLIKKGLSNEEIDAAIEKASVSAAPFAQSQIMLPTANNGSSQMYRPSMWSRIHRYSSAVVVVGIVLYGLQQFYKLYIEPLLYGAKKRDGRLSQMEEQLLELSRSLSHLRKSVSSIEETLAAQKDELQKYLSHKCNEMDQSFNPALLHDLKSEISTVKSLLLNRRQFPDVPKISPCIPSWQMAGGGGKGEKLREKETEDGGEDKDCIELAPDAQPEDEQKATSPLEREFDEEPVDGTEQESDKKDEPSHTPSCDELCNGTGGCIHDPCTASTSGCQISDFVRLLQMLPSACFDFQV